MVRGVYRAATLLSLLLGTNVLVLGGVIAYAYHLGGEWSGMVMIVDGIVAAYGAVMVIVGLVARQAKGPLGHVGLIAWILAGPGAVTLFTLFHCAKLATH